MIFSTQIKLVTAVEEGARNEREEYDTLKSETSSRSVKKKAHVRVQFNFLRREKELGRIRGGEGVELVFVHPRGFVLEGETSDNNGRP